MKSVLLIDFGSTYTKLTAVDADSGKLLGTAADHTTQDTDISEGLTEALNKLHEKIGKIEYTKRLACSSAAGGLRMVACGLVPELTAKAAKMALLGAGAKLVGLYSYQLTENDRDEIDDSSPDILLLAGGTDGGNRACILHNAEILATTKHSFPIIIAGNRTCAKEVAALLKDKPVFLVDNVMPMLNTLNIEPARKKIREIFLEKIINAKGLSSLSDLISGIIMPTPAAVLSAMELLSGGCEDEKGLGELMAVDLGGATTDVYSIAAGLADGVNVIYKGLPEPFSKRTVEGDVGMRYTAEGILESAGLSRAASLAGLKETEVQNYTEKLRKTIGSLPQNDKEKALDFALAALAVETATMRHCGSLEEVYTATGQAFLQMGKDLRKVKKVIMTGGALIHADRKSELAQFALYSDKQPQSLRPERAELLFDKQYIIAAMGLLGAYFPKAALRILKNELVTI